MAAFNLFLLALLALWTMPLFISTTTARSLNYNPIGSNPNPNPNLEARLNLDEESSNCWDSLFQLHACSGEVVMFFLNGETYLGHGCCVVIRTIEHQCWPALLGTLGFTTEETDVLKGYCDEADHIQSPPVRPPSPPAADKPIN
ncbi:hypothetical protein CerSpe_214170 [Prunus speciosa]